MGDGGRGTRIVVAGLGDAGTMTAIHLRRRLPRAEVVGIGTVPGLVSGQELGLRLARPGDWERDHRVPHGRFRGLDGVRVLQARVAGLGEQEVRIENGDGTARSVPFDVLVVATGVAAGFWRRDDLRSLADVDEQTAAVHRRLAAADRIAVVGGGASAVTSAVQLACALPHVRVDLYFPGERGLPHHHRLVWGQVAARLAQAGVEVHPGHRAVVPPGAADGPTDGPVSWVTGQPDAAADVVLWAVGTSRPHTGWLPPGLLDGDGYVRVRPTLQLPEHPHVFAVGDVAASDPLRSSARNWGGRLVARNVAAHLDGGPLEEHRAPRRRWGSVLGPLDEGVVIFTPHGRGVRIPIRVFDRVVQPLATRRWVWGGLRGRRPDPPRGA